MTQNVKLWGIHGGPEGEADDLFVKERVVALGWNRVGDLSNLYTRSELKTQYGKAYTEDKSRRVANIAGQIYQFIHKMKTGDFIVYPRKLAREIWIGKIMGEYEYNSKFAFPHLRRVEWLKQLPRESFSPNALHEVGAAITFFAVRNFGQEFLAALEQEQGLARGNDLTRRIYTEQGDPEIEGLYGKYKKGKLVIQGDFQRHFIWDPKKCSRLIESILLDIPLPLIYIFQEQDDRESVIDGQQRLSALFGFIDGEFPDKKEARLIHLEVFSALNGKLFKELDEALQDKIRYYKIRTITFKKESDPNLKFEIFERLNTGAMPLNDQELRNCVYRGPYNELFRQLAEDKDFKYILGLKNLEKRMRDIELVLRFAAFYHSSYLKYAPPMKVFLNNDMERYQNLSVEESAEIKNAFKNSVSIIKSLLDKHAFKRFYRGENERRPGGYWEPKKFNASLYDILMNSFAKEDKNKIYQNLDSIREALIDLMTSDQEFINSIELSTSSQSAVMQRFDKWRLALQKIVGTGQKEPRCFSLKLKEELYNDDPTCAMENCGQKIQSIDDAAIDHIDQYWTGGKTIPENARLTHRYCNWARPRKGSF